MKYLAVFLITKWLESRQPVAVVMTWRTCSWLFNGTLAVTIGEPAEKKHEQTLLNYCRNTLYSSLAYSVTVWQHNNAGKVANANKVNESWLHPTL